MTTPVEASYALCQQAARRASSSFYYSFLLLPRAKRRAMCALYAFLRKTDDLGDGDSGPGDAKSIAAQRAELAAWRASFRRALQGSFDDPLLPALADTVERFAIPPEHLEAVIDGVEMDLQGSRYETWDELALYCHRVASVVGLACIQIWGYRDELALEPARQCGLAFQLTNILRDLKEDAQRGRIYLPAEDLRRFAYSPDDLRAGIRDARFRALMKHELDRAEQFYRQAEELQGWLSSDGVPIFGTMLSTYRGLLDEIRRLDGDVFTSRVRLSSWRRLRIAARWLFRRPAAITRDHTDARP
ncbi:MAG: phytoene/squalene synthase family protein [Pirellulales bacterium]